MKILHSICFYLSCSYTKCSKKWKEVPSKAMADNEIQTFDINTHIKTECTLSPAKYHVKKQFQVNNFQDEFVFYAARYNDVDLEVSPQPPFPDHVDSIGYASCTHGMIDVVYVNPLAQNCGIGKVLSALCMLDPQVYRVEKRNKVYRRLQLYYTDVAHLYNCDRLVGLRNTVRNIESETPYTGVFVTQCILPDFFAASSFFCF